ncbi:hypothetical protein CHARACLAT_012099 [Characodon lateralis]|uniref:Uncharacterized protein n=1 Tax=Characodon lateralis TaxID=208331 RepID=A0ABU7D6H2_9TELE|nr:hypothetical protein [Characodon lateralis]
MSFWLWSSSFSSSSASSRTGSRGQQIQQRPPDQGVPGPAERHRPSSVSWASSQWDMPGTPPEEGIRETSGIDAQATSTGSSRCGGAAALLRAPHPISKGVPGQPTEEAHFHRLYPGSRSFGHDPKFMAIGEGRNVDRPVNRELRFSAQLSLHHNGPAQRPHYCGSRTDPSVDLPLHSSLTHEQDPEILKLLHLRRELPSPSTFQSI